MSDQPEETQDASYAEGEETRIHSLDDLNSRMGRLESLLAKIVPGSHAEAQERTEERLDRPSDVHAQVQAELKRAREEEARQQAEQARAKEDESLRETVKRLAEKPPAPPVKRSTKVMWGGK